MRIQSLDVSYGVGGVQNVVKRRARKRRDVLHPHEIAHRKRGSTSGSASCGQHVIGPGRIVGGCHRRERTQEYAAGIVDPPKQGVGVMHKDLQMLGGVVVDHVYGLVKVVGDDHEAALAERTCDCAAPGQGIDLDAELALDLCGQLSAGGYQDRF